MSYPRSTGPELLSRPRRRSASAHVSTRRLPFVCVLLVLVLAAAVPATSAAALGGSSSTPDRFVALPGTDPEIGLFVVREEVAPYRQQLWRTDGTSAGTFRADTCDGCQYFSPLGGQGGQFWEVHDGAQTFAWSDGTPAGFRRMPMVPGGEPLREHYSTALDRLLYVRPGPDGTQRQVWSWDGEGEPRPLLPPVRGVAGFADAGGLAYVQTLDEAGRFHIWVTDGTTGGTRDLGVSGGSPIHDGEVIHPAGDRVVLFAQEDCRIHVWAASTTTGVEQVATLEGEICDSNLWDNVQSVGDRVFFIAYSRELGREIWSTDGTAAGTHRITDIDHVSPSVSKLVPFDGAVYFSVHMPQQTSTLWRSDGTAAGTGPLPDPCGGCDSAGGPRLEEGELYWTASRGEKAELWVGDGTAAGSRLRTVLRGSSYQALVHSGGTWYEFTEGSRVDSVIYASPPGTSELQAIARFPWHPGSLLFVSLSLNGKVVFRQDDGLHGTEPWVTDGTADGTHLLRDIATDGTATTPPAAPTHPSLPSVSDGSVFLRWELADTRPVEGRLQIDARRPGEDWFRVFEGTAYPSSAATLRGLPADTPHTFRARVVTAAGTSPWSEEVSVRTWSGYMGDAACTPSDERLCFEDGRFSVKVSWWNQHHDGPVPETGEGRRAPGGGDGRSAYLWFFKPDNVELILKMLDGYRVNRHAWLFYGALTDVEYWITVHDHRYAEGRTYHNLPGEICGRADTAAFPGVLRMGDGADQPLARLELPSTSRFDAAHPEIPCVEDATTLCLLDGRYAVTVNWYDQHNDRSGAGGAVPYADRTGFFWFFREDNIELVVKILDGTPVNGKTWVFYGALTDVGYTLTVTDTATGHAVETYVNEPGNICGGADTDAF